MKLLKSKKIIGLITILLVVFGVIFYLSIRLTIVVPTKLFHSKIKTPEAYLVPINHEIRIGDQVPELSYKLLFKNIRFTVPWELRKRTELDYSILFEFVNKKGISISLQGKDESILSGLMDEGVSKFQESKLIFGEENLISEYALVNLILHTTPDHASLLKPYRDLLKIPPILIWRVLYTHLGDVIYNFELDNLRGFQFGDPQDTEHIYVLLFCNKFMVFRLHFIGATQDEIDYMLTTVEFF